MAEEKQRLTLFLDPGLVKKGKAQAIEDGISLSTYIERLLDKELPKVVKVSDYVKLPKVREKNWRIGS